jgi:hypothetical protein
MTTADYKTLDLDTVDLADAAVWDDGPSFTPVGSGKSVSGKR